MIDRLKHPQIENELKTLNGWQHSTGRDAIEKTFKFKDFKTAWQFMTSIAKIADTMDHHPEWSNIYNRVNIALTTHDANGISEKDIKMAREIESVCKLLI